MIGSSSGAFFKDSFNRELGLNDNRDYMDIDPDTFMRRKDNPEYNIDDQGEVVPKPMPKLPEDQFNTPLDPEDRQGFDSKFSKQDLVDYDMQGWYKANKDTAMEPGQHYPDTFKKPNHPTFSDESMYSNDQAKGGRWSTVEGKDTFSPGPENMKQHGVAGLLDYFDKNEPSVQLLLPGK